MTCPAGPTALDAAWLEGVLRREGGVPDARVDRIVTKTIGEGFGLEGTSVRIAIDGLAPKSLVGKWLGAAGGAREARFYRDVAPLLDLDLPRLYAGIVDEPSDRALLLLEDVAPARQGDVFVAPAPGDGSALVAAMAALHAPFWARTEHPAISWVPPWKPDPAERARQTQDALPRFLQAWGDGLSREGRAAAEDTPRRLPDAFATLQTAPPTLIHGDFHVDNVLFRPDGTPVVLDWPHVARGPAALDFAGSFIKRGSPDERRAHRGELLDEYASALVARGVGNYERGRIASDSAAAATVLLAGTMRWAARTDDPRLAIPRVRSLIESAVRITVATAVEGLT